MMTVLSMCFTTRDMRELGPWGVPEPGVPKKGTASMRAQRLVLMTAVCSIVFLAGCGTIGARATTRNPPPFAGLRTDFGAFGELFTNKEEIKPVWMYWMVVPLVSGIIVADIPVSTVFDLYCLPVDLSRRDHPSGELNVSIEKESSKNGGNVSDDK